MTRLGRRLTLVLVLGALFLGASLGLSGSLKGPLAPAAGCTCAQERLRNGWCAACARGYVAGCEIRSRGLFDALDAHGHLLDPAVMECNTCKALVGSGGFCEACRFGWIDGQAYMSRLTYHLGKGTTRDPAALTCSTCRDLAGGVGWCDACGGGWSGNRFFADRQDYEDAARQFQTLLAAIEVSARCETCSLVMLVDGTCPYCRISYQGGKARPNAGG